MNFLEIAAATAILCVDVRGKEWKMAVINGKKEPEAVGRVLADYLTEKGYGLTRIAVECSGEIVPKSKYEEKVIQDGEIIEIVSFVGGG